MNPFIQLTTADPSLGKIDTASMSHQTLMELLVSNFDDRSFFRDTDNDFTEISLWEGVTVNEHQEVTAIHWQSFHFGFEDLPQAGGSVDLKWVPSTLRILKIPYMSLCGTIDTHGLPRGLTHFDITSNRFAGTFETSGLPKDVETIRANFNKLTGNFEFSMLPPALKLLSLSYNTLSGTVDFESLPKSLETLWLSFNRFSGEMNLRVLPESVKDMSLEGNSFDTDKSLMIRKGAISQFLFDRGEVEEIVNTDGEHMDFTFREKELICLKDIIA